MLCAEGVFRCRELAVFLLLHQKEKIKTKFLWVEILREKMFLSRK